MDLHGLPWRRIASVHEDFNWKAWRTYRPTVQEASKSASGRKWKYKEETALGSRSAAGPVSRLHKSGNLREEKVSLAHHRLLTSARFMEVRFRVRRLFLTCILFLLDSRCPSVRGCPHCGILTNHKNGCKQMTKPQHVTTRHDVRK